MSPVKLIIVGAGNRGKAYAEYAKLCPEKLQIVGVAEPLDWHREWMAERFEIPMEMQFKSWQELAKKEKLADAVVIATQDTMHVDPVVAFANLKYHILLEKPMATNEADCRKIVEVAQKNNIILAVCHVLRYTNYTQNLKKILNSGRIGEIVSIQHFEPVGFWHQAHSFVRGNWRNSQESTFMLLAKSCHDMDWIRYVMGKKCLRVSSFGSLHHFRKENKPAGAADRCVVCPTEIEATCPFSAKRIYYKFFNKGNKGWPVDIVTPEPTSKNLADALEKGPYGRCVYACDNDVVDHQVVNFEFEGGGTASFTMTAFCPSEGRKTTIHGTRGYIVGDSSNIKIFDYLTEQWETIDTRQTDSSLLGGHGGGDGGIIENFTNAVMNNNPHLILSGPEVSLESHLIAFYAEKSRLNGTIESIQ